MDIRAYNKKLGFFVGCPHSSEALLSIIVISFFLALQPVKVVINILLLKTRILIYINGKTQ